MIYRAFFVFILTGFSLQLQAEQFLGKAAIKQTVLEHLQSVYSEQYGEGKLASHIQFNISNLDNRLRLTKCTTPLSKQITSPSPLAQQISVKVACEGDSPWTIYVPVRVDTYSDIAVAARNLNRGAQLTMDDIRFTRVNIAQTSGGYFESSNNVLGMELKRSLRAGMTITRQALKSPTIIKRGETVTLEATGAGIAVVTNAKALSAGQLGQQIQVQNLSSRRTVDARVVGPGRVQVTL